MALYCFSCSFLARLLTQPSVPAFGQGSGGRVQLIDHRDRRIGYDRRHYRGHYGRYQGPYYAPYAYYGPYYGPYAGLSSGITSVAETKLTRDACRGERPSISAEAVETSCAKWKGSNRKCPRELERSLHGHGLWVRCS